MSMCFKQKSAQCFKQYKLCTSGTLDTPCSPLLCPHSPERQVCSALYMQNQVCELDTFILTNVPTRFVTLTSSACWHPFHPLGFRMQNN